VKTIEKSPHSDSGCYPLDNKNKMPPSGATQAKSSWDKFKHKKQVTQLLCAEQHGLCAYSEIRPDQYNLGTHIEHVKPKSLFPSQTFDYHNLVLSALSDTDLKIMNNEAVFGGHAKLNKYNSTQFVSCLQANCADFFAYLSNGQVEASLKLTSANAQKARYTIDVLNLNSPYLVNQRKKWLDELEDCIDEHLDKGWSLKDLAVIYLCPVKDKLYPFFTANCQRFGVFKSLAIIKTC